VIVVVPKYWVRHKSPVGASLLAMDGAAIRHSELTSLKNKMSFPDAFFRAPDQ
jgi:hypothetical protein